MKKIAFGILSDWFLHAQGTIDRDTYSIECVDFAKFNLELTDYVVPLSLDDAAALRRRYGGRFGKYILPDADLIDLCADKKRFNERILASRFASLIPPIYETSARKFPYMLKKRGRVSGEDIFAVRDAADEAPLAALLHDPDYFCQAHVPGRMEYATHMLMAGGRMVYHATNAYEMAAEFAVKGNAQSPLREAHGVDIDDEMLEEMIELLRMLGFNGTCCFDYKIADGRMQLLELNPRVGFSLFLDINWYLYAYTAAVDRQLAQGL